MMPLFVTPINWTIFSSALLSVHRLLTLSFASTQQPYRLWLYVYFMKIKHINACLCIVSWCRLYSECTAFYCATFFNLYLWLRCDKILFKFLFIIRIVHWYIVACWLTMWCILFSQYFWVYSEISAKIYQRFFRPPYRKNVPQFNNNTAE